jgi:transposase
VPPAIPSLELNQHELERILERALTAPLAPDDYQKLHAVLDTLAYMTQLLENKNTTLQRLRQIVFGASTEKTRQVLQNVANDGVCSPASPETSEQSNRTPSPEPPCSEPAESAPSPGHGRNGAQAYAGAEKVKVGHATLKPGDRCPKCEKGKVYAMATLGVLVRLVGQAPLAATVYELEKLRCNLCGEVFTAEPPARAGPDKYDATAASMIALLKYGSGFPFHRLQGLQENLGTPLPASTQWEIVAKTAAALRPAYQELIYQAAQGEVLYNDDTTMKVLALMGKNPRRSESAETAEEEDSERTGIFTSGIVSTRAGQKIALFFTGRKHAGENLATVLAQRAQELGPPIQMCDGLTRNLPKAFQTILGNCLLHGRRKFVEVAPRFPEECRYLLETLGEVYKHDAFCRKQGMSAEERLAFHQAHSGPLMKALEDWFTAQFAERKVEPNSGLGQAITYMQKRWDRLTLFLRQAGAPLDSNAVERILKRAILHRKNAYFYKTKNGARVGDLFMSLIHTCQLHGVNAFEYLTELQKHAEELAARPPEWMPWNYRDACRCQAKSGVE